MIITLVISLQHGRFTSQSQRYVENIFVIGGKMAELCLNNDSGPAALTSFQAVAVTRVA